MDLPVLDISYKRNHVTCGPLRPASFLNMIRSSFTHVAACVRTSFLFLLKNIPLCGHTTFYLAVYQSVGVLVVYTSWLLGVTLRCVCVYTYLHTSCLEGIQPCSVTVLY